MTCTQHPERGDDALWAHKKANAVAEQIATLRMEGDNFGWSSHITEEVEALQCELARWNRVAAILRATPADAEREEVAANLLDIVEDWVSGDRHYLYPNEKDTLVEAARLLRTPAPEPQPAGEVERLKERIDLRLNNYLVEMKEGYDDSITGFNEAWDIVRAVFGERTNDR